MANPLWGFLLRRKVPPVAEVLPSFAPPADNDGALTFTGTMGFGGFGTYLDLENAAKSEADLVTRYRMLALQPEAEAAISEVVNEAIVDDEDEDLIVLELDDIEEIPESLKTKIHDEFSNVLDLLKFELAGYSIFQRWYIDGRCYYHLLVDKDNLADGIQEIRYIDPRKIRKVREILKMPPQSAAANTNTPGDTFRQITEYFLYNEQGFGSNKGMGGGNNNQSGPLRGIKIAKDAITYATSGVIDETGTLMLGFLHGAIKPLNQLRTLEDAVVIYRLCVAGDSRIKTTNGWKYIKDIHENEEVFSFNPETGKQEQTKITGWWNKGTQKTFKITSKHFNLEATATHPILARDKTTGLVAYVDTQNLVVKRHQIVVPPPHNEWDEIPFPQVRNNVAGLVNNKIWVQDQRAAKEQSVIETASVVSLAPTQVRNFLYGLQTLPEEKAVTIINLLALDDELKNRKEGWARSELYLPDFVNEDFARLFGFLIGDGSVQTYGVSFAEGTDEPTNQKYINLMRKFFGKCVRCGCKGRKYGSYNSHNTLAAELLRDMGFITGAHNKRVPEWVFRASPAIKRAFIEGLSNADGCERYTSRGTWFSTISLCNRKLVEDIKEIWSSIGLASGQIKKRERKGGHFITPARRMKATTSWEVTISYCELPKYENILSVVPWKDQEVFDIQVASNFHNFICNGMPVHNTRAPERRVWYLDTGNLPRSKAEAYMQENMSRHRMRLNYDATTGSIMSDSKYITMTEDYWLARGAGDRGTKVETLPAGDLTGKMDDVLFFQKKLYKSLQVPISRLMPEDLYMVGRASEVSREEVKFARFVARLRRRFAQSLFSDMLGKQLALKGIMSPDDWDEIQPKLIYRFARSNIVKEFRDQEIWTARGQTYQSLMPIIGHYISHDTVRRKIMGQSDEEIDEEDKQIEEDADKPQYEGMNPAEQQPEAPGFGPEGGGMEIPEEPMPKPPPGQGQEPAKPKPMPKPGGGPR